MPIGIDIYSWYIYLYPNRLLDIHLYTMYKDTLYVLWFPMYVLRFPLYILRFPMYILCFPLLFSGSRQCIYIDDHGILHYMTCSSAFLVPAAAAPCALLARLNAALLLLA